MGFIDRLQHKWNLKNAWQVVVVLIVFACTGLTIMYIKKPIQAWLAVSDDYATLFTVMYYVFILPIYNIVLLIYGFLFGQFSFFWSFEKRMWNRMIGRSKRDEV